jgi:hypothetical protein
MRDLVRLLRQRLVVHGARAVRVEAKIELILPAELEAGADSAGGTDRACNKVIERAQCPSPAVSYYRILILS